MRTSSSTTDADRLVARLETDLQGPFSSDEVLTSGFPTDVYLTGILWPREEEIGAEEAERLDSAGSGNDDEQGGVAEEVPLNGLKRPCTAGLSFALKSTGAPAVEITLAFGLYEPRDARTQEKGDINSRVGSGTPAHGSLDEWCRRDQKVNFQNLQLPVNGYERKQITSEGLPQGIVLYLRTKPVGEIFLVTITVINEMIPTDRSRASIERVTMCQVELNVRASSGTSLVPKPRAGRPRDDEEERSAALLYRDCSTFAVGHTCSALWEGDGEVAECVRTSWLPRAEVPRVSSEGDAVFEPLSARADFQCLEARWLARASRVQLREALLLLAACYAQWIEKQEQRCSSIGIDLRKQAAQNLGECRAVQQRLAEAAALIVDIPAMLESFQLANEAMQLQHEWNPDRKRSGPLKWRPFQLAFMVLAGPSSCLAEDPDRGVMDLLWFPTGGGKTEAYLGLVALVAFYRRLSIAAPESDVSVAAIMRYTLRLLTTQQFLRASALILACEAIRRGQGRDSDVASRLGARPFSIGLWVGGDATPNSFEDAQKALRGDKNFASPEQLTTCPCCQTKLAWRANPATLSVVVRCPSRQCVLGSCDDPLPVWTVDTDVYRECPTLLIGTVDKFAQLPRREEVRRLFGMGTQSTPDLIVQDELHLISGPLGTIVALYEVAFDWLVKRGNARPKVIGSTATIRRGRYQVQALFNRTTRQFPPSGIDNFDSGFATTSTVLPGRIYLGISTAGRSAKFSLQAIAGCLLQAANGAITDPSNRDPYSTLVTYFNSLRELGGALVLMQDDVEDSVKLFATRHAEVQREARNIEELTSRRSQAEVRDMLEKLATKSWEDGAVDAVLATNMVSVGVDVPRLGLMLVNGQPKTRSEYIQATSRVGRDKSQGLVVVILNSAKPRDRSHYETFGSWHQSLYRDVEPTSVTPFASRARDRALRAVIATMVRHGITSFSASPQAFDTKALGIQEVIDEIVGRARDIDPGEPWIQEEIERSLTEWQARKPKAYWNDHRPAETLMQSAERAAALKAMGRSVGDAWPTLNNMRSVEPSVKFRLAERLRADPRSDSNGQ